MHETRRTKRARQGNTSKLRLLKKAALYRGLYARVATREQCHISTVGRVARGERQSPRIEAAIIAEINRIEREAESAA